MANLFHTLYVLGLMLVAAAFWLPRFVPNRVLFVAAMAAWLVGVLAVWCAFTDRGPLWLAAPVRNFRFERQVAAQPLLGNRHRILTPEATERFPAEFDALRRDVHLELAFELLPDGSLQNVQVMQPSRVPGLDAATTRAVQRWRFGALPAARTVAAPERVRVTIHNNYSAAWSLGTLLPFATVYFLLWGLTVASCSTIPTGSLEEEVTVQTVQRLLLLAGFLAGQGWLLIYRLGPDIKRYDLPVKQGVFLLLSLGLLPLVLHGARLLRMRLKNVTGSPATGMPGGWGYALLGVLLLLVTRFTPLGTDFHTGAKLWLRMGGLPFQTVELVKLMMVAFLAMAAYGVSQLTRPAIQVGHMGYSRLITTRERVQGVVGAFGLVFASLALMSDFGPALLLFLLLIFGFAIQAERRLSVLAATLLVLMLLLMFVTGMPERWHDRVMMWRNPWKATASETIQLQAGREHISRMYWSISSGGLLGLGLGQGMPGDIKAVESDFVFVAFAEETGWLGSVSLLALLLYLPVACFRLAPAYRDAYDKTLIAGLAGLFGIQAALIVGGNIGLWPLTGITLPLVSYGGASLTINFIAIALLCGTLLQPARMPHVFPRDREINRILHGLSIAATVVMALFVFTLWRLQESAVGRAISRQPHLRADNTPLRNPRLDASGNIERVRQSAGRVLDRRGIVVAETTPRGRVHLSTETELSLLGFKTERGQRIGLDSILNPLLAGHLPEAMPSRGTTNAVLTLDTHLQVLAARLLERHHYKGSMVGVDPVSGEILFAVSRPSWEQLPPTPAEWQAAQQGKSYAVPLWYRRLYAPGSVFKTVLLPAGLESGTLSPNTVFACDGEFLGIRDFERSTTHSSNFAHGALSTREAFTVSCNAFFGQAAQTVGWERLTTFATLKAGFEHSFSLLPEAWRGSRFDWLETAPSRVVIGESNRSRQALAMTGIGQCEVRMTPLHLALWAGAIANGGQMMQPTVVNRITDATGSTVWQWQPKPHGEAMSQTTADCLTGLMEQVVQRGTGRKARIPGIRIAGKTGTAETLNGKDALFIGFAPAHNPRIAVAVVIENGDTGGGTAAPLAAEMLRAVCQ